MNIDHFKHMYAYEKKKKTVIALCQQLADKLLFYKQMLFLLESTEQPEESILDFIYVVTMRTAENINAYTRDKGVHYAQSLQHNDISDEDVESILDTL